jgi:hypothetical protein
MILGVSMLLHLRWLAAPVPVAPLPQGPATESAGTAADALAQSLRHPLLPAAAENASATVAPQPTALDARLRGVSTGLRLPVAIIDHAGQSRVVGEGDVLGAARIERILPDRVVLERDGRLETLSLHREPAAGGGPGAVDAGPEAAGARDADMDQWMNNLSEADPETAAWLRERMRELHDQPAND